MENYQAVRSGLDIGQTIADCLEQTDPRTYNGSNRVKTIRAVNDILQGRSARTTEELLAGLEALPQAAALRRDIQDFLAQKERLDRPYSSMGVMAYHPRFAHHSRERPLKVIDQALYDQAAREGFPLEFFRKSYFDHVTVYCLPEHADCNFSYFDNCSFQVCRISGATFDGATLASCAFHTARLDHVTFFSASITYTRFCDSSFNWVSFQMARMKSCSTIDCDLHNVGFLDTILDGCSYGRVTAENTRCLHTAQITQGGATEEECAQNRAGILQALCPQQEPTPRRTPEKRRGR